MPVSNGINVCQISVKNEASARGQLKDVGKRPKTLQLLSKDEEEVWRLFQKGIATGEISRLSSKGWSVAYVSRVLHRGRKKIREALLQQAKSHRLDTDSILDYNGILIGFDYAANASVFIIFTVELGIIVWYKHPSYAGKLCPECPKEGECKETLDVVIHEYNIKLREEEEEHFMTQKSIEIFNRLATKETPRYRRSRTEDESN